MNMSISIQKSTKRTNIKHNNREMNDKEKEKNAHIDYSRSDENKYLVQDDLRELYEREFGNALEKYNAKQKRSDRKIGNYYNHIQSSKKTSLQQEMIIQIGDKDDFSSNDDIENANRILEKWFNDFEQRNPNLRVYNAVIHNDEATPHMHLNFVPVASGYKRGLEKQVAFDKAIKQQDNSLDKTRPFDDWRTQEVEEMEKLLNERGIERKLVGGNNYKDVREYKERKDLQQEIKSLDSDLDMKKSELKAFSDTVMVEVKVKVEEETKEIEVPTGEKNFFGIEKKKTKEVPTGNVILPAESYEKMVNAVESKYKLEEKLKRILETDVYKENESLSKENNDLMGKYNNLVDRFNTSIDKREKLKRENNALRWNVDVLKREIGFIYKTTKNILRKRTGNFRGVLDSFTDKLKDRAGESEFVRLHEAEKHKSREDIFSLSEIEKMDENIKKSNVPVRKNKSHGMEL